MPPDPLKPLQSVQVSNCPVLLVNPTSRLDFRDQGRSQYEVNRGTCLSKTFVTKIFLNFSAIFTAKNNFSLNEHWIYGGFQRQNRFVFMLCTATWLFLSNLSVIFKTANF